MIVTGGYGSSPATWGYGVGPVEELPEIFGPDAWIQPGLSTSRPAELRLQTALLRAMVEPSLEMPRVETVRLDGAIVTGKAHRPGTGGEIIYPVIGAEASVPGLTPATEKPGQQTETEEPGTTAGALRPGLKAGS